MLPGSIVLELNPAAGNARNSEGAFVTLRDGSLLFAYTRYHGQWADHANADIVLRRSTDQGQSWSDRDEMLLLNEGHQNVMSVSLLRLHNGDIAFFYLRKNGPDDCRPYLRLSHDEAQSWSEPIAVIAAPGYFVLNNDRVIQLASGRLVAPVAYHRLRSPTAIDGRGIALWYLSDDDGKSWREASHWWAAPVQNPAGLQEPGVIELSEGALLSWFRTGAGCQYRSMSGDSGETWTAPEASPFQSPTSPLSMKYLADQQGIIAVWNDHSGRLLPAGSSKDSWGRTPLVAAISRDNARSWTTGIAIEDSPEHGFCYCAIHAMSDAVLLAYCAGGADSGGVLNRLRLRRIAISDLQ